MALNLLEQNVTYEQLLTAANVGSSSWGDSTVVHGTNNPTEMPPTLLKSVLVGTILVLLALATIVGNLLVIFSVCLDRHLHSPPNILIVNLAVADLMVALIVMPFSIAELVGPHWTWSKITCNVALNADVLCCTGSIVTLCVISVDRYLAITRPFKYAPKRTPRLMLLMVLIVWIISVFISLAPYFSGGNSYKNNQCKLSEEYGFTIFSTVGAFYLPMVIMLVVYYKIYRAAKRSEKAEKQRRPSILPTGITASRRSSHASESSQNGDHSERRKSFIRLAEYVKNKARPSIVSMKPSNGRRRISLRGERKAAKTLGVIMGAFTLCWLPFFTFALLVPFCHACQPPLFVVKFILWLGYANSAINPVIYPLFNKDFGPAYKRLLSCKCAGDCKYVRRRQPFNSNRSSGSVALGNEGTLNNVSETKRNGDSGSNHDRHVNVNVNVQYMDLTATDLLNANTVGRRPSDLDKISEASEESGCDV
ncbi:5-hydroxytryptamine receptor 1 [Holothuria leucospilota]|uniref:5-hydroxytryptamine receptor 1 n=1 Tax=Holothuria leucospilota TaxID=206669 RepID=A0A9Q0YTZ7_HOLLE|nr:5-hydroxytryptamine receptor 1 [Holothuria leucospilota]